MTERDKKINERMNAVLDVTLREAAVRHDGMDAEAEKIAIVAAVGGVALCIRQTLNEEARDLSQQLAIEVAQQLGPAEQMSSLVDAFGNPYQLPN